MRAQYEMADVLNAHWQQVESHPLINTWQLRTLGAIKRCRTSQMGGHVDACTECGTLRVSYNSCRNRHCPKCQGKEREAWIQKREEELLPVPYFHVVFTLPGLLNQTALYKPKEVYSTLFWAAWDTLKTFAADPKHLGAQTGMIAILHTWGQTLNLHPHLHCIVPGGGITPGNKWKIARNKGKYLFPVKAMNHVFRAKYMELIRQKVAMNKELENNLFKQPWVVFAKRPFANTGCVIEYLGRYTHKIAISNHRIKAIDHNGVTFSYKDYRKGGKQEMMTLELMEFIHRFSMHILPKAFVRIRHYGILSSTCKKVAIPLIKQQIPLKKVSQKYTWLRSIIPAFVLAVKLNPWLLSNCLLKEDRPTFTHRPKTLPFTQIVKFLWLCPLGGALPICGVTGILFIRKTIIKMKSTLKSPAKTINDLSFLDRNN